MQGGSFHPVRLSGAVLRFAPACVLFDRALCSPVGILAEVSTMNECACDSASDEQNLHYHPFFRCTIWGVFACRMMHHAITRMQNYSKVHA